MRLASVSGKFDVESYLAWEATQVEKYEYHAGEVFAMVGAKLSHNTVALNLAVALKNGLRGGPCRVFGDGTKVRVEAADAVLYPDVVVTCDVRDRGPEDRFLAHPTLIVEVLSDSTAAYDRGEKFALYRRLPSLREYVLVDVDSRRAESFRLNAAGHWELHDCPEEIEMVSLGVIIPIAEAFEGLDSA